MLCRTRPPVTLACLLALLGQAPALAGARSRGPAPAPRDAAALLEIRASAVDGAGNVYAAGRVRGPAFEAVGGLSAPTERGATGFVTVRSGDGRRVLYATALGGPDAAVSALAVAADGLVTVVGQAPAGAAQDLAPAVEAGPWGGADVFVAQLDPQRAGAASLRFGVRLAGAGDDAAAAVALGPTGLVYVAYARGGARLAVLDPSAHGPEALVYSGALGGSAGDRPVALAVDAEGDAFVAGATAGGDAFLVRIDPFASATPAGAVRWRAVLGGRGADAATALALDPQGRPLVAGTTRSVDFPRSSCSPPPSTEGSGPTAFVARFSLQGALEASVLADGAVERVAGLPDGRFWLRFAGTRDDAGDVATSREAAVLWDCRTCPAGQALDGAGTSATCRPCAPGTASADGGACQACPAGSAAPDAGSNACQACPAGTASADDGRRCAPCPAGLFSPAGEACEPCPAGTVSAGGAAGCYACPAGSAPTSDGERCELCPAGTASAEGQACAPCAPNETSTTGAAACTELCAPGQLGHLSAAGLTPAFRPGQLTYAVPDADGPTLLRVAACDPNDVLRLDGRLLPRQSAPTSAQPTDLPTFVTPWLRDGPARLTVTRADGATSTYIIAYQTGLPTPERTGGVEALSAPGLWPPFDPSRTEYTLSAPPSGFVTLEAARGAEADGLRIAGRAARDGEPHRIRATAGTGFDVVSTYGGALLGRYHITVVPSPYGLWYTPPARPALTTAANDRRPLAPLEGRLP